MRPLRDKARIPLYLLLFLFTAFAASAVAERLDMGWSTGLAVIVCLLVLIPLANTVFAQYGPLWMLATGLLGGLLLLWLFGVAGYLR